MNTKSSVETEKRSETDIFSFLTDHASHNNLAVALWRLPNQNIKHAIISEQPKLRKPEETIEDLPAGFLLAPFDRGKENIYLSADFSFVFENAKLKEPDTTQETKSLTWLHEKIKKHAINKPEIYGAGSIVKESTKSKFINLVERGVEEIEKGTFQKIVVSRTREIELPNDFNIIEAFQKLCQVYPNALVSFVSIPGVGNWLGATPEVLVCLQDKIIFKTVALAGTKLFSENINLKSVAWTQKEIEEQALVERYIISCFKKIRLREYDEFGPKTIVAGNLLHLKSEFTVNMKETNFPQLGSVMLQLLHPTSAVCGMPLEPSLDFIKQYEGYDRAFYAGYLGPVNIDNNTSLFVNIRCMQIHGSNATCYAGAGITSDSIAENEWEETELKFDTLLSVVFKK